MSLSVKIMSNPARSRPTSPPINPLVSAVAHDGLCTFEFGYAVEVFASPRPEMGPDSYRLAAEEPGPLRSRPRSRSGNPRSDRLGSGYGDGSSVRSAFHYAA